MEGQTQPDPVMERPDQEPVTEPKRQRMEEQVLEGPLMEAETRRLDNREQRRLMRMDDELVMRKSRRVEMDEDRMEEAEEEEEEMDEERAEMEEERAEMDGDRMKADMEEEERAEMEEDRMKAEMERWVRITAEYERVKAEMEAQMERVNEGIRIFQVWWNAWLMVKQEEDREEREDHEEGDKSWKMWGFSNEYLFIELHNSVWEEKMKELRWNIWKKKKKVEQELEDVEDAELITYYKNYIDHRNWWKKKYPGYVQFENITTEICMYYSLGPVPHLIFEGPRPRTVQVFSVKIGGSNWPLQLYGLIAVRDFVDPQRNMIFNRYRDECQIVTEKDPYLSLTGPTRAVVIDMNESMGPVTIEAELKVREAVESEDKYIILDAISLPSLVGSRSFELAGPNMKLEILLGAIERSVEATIFIRVVNGTWPTGFHGQFVAKTSSIEWNEVILLEFSGDGAMKQTRSVMSVEASGILNVTLKSSRGLQVASLNFNATNRGVSAETFNLGSCRVQVLVGWSLIKPYCGEFVSPESMKLFNF